MNFAIEANPELEAPIRESLKRAIGSFDECQFEQCLHSNFKTSICVVAGGDGSLRRAVQKILEHKASEHVTLAYVPAGTGNDFARATGLLSMSLDDIIALIVQNKPKVITLGQMNQFYFANVASCGEFAEVTPNVDERLKAMLGSWSYYLEAVKYLKELAAHRYVFYRDGQKLLETEAFGFFVGNSRYCGGGVQVTAHADPQSDRLDLLIVKQMQIPEIINNLLKLQWSQPDVFSEHMVYSRFNELRVESREPIPTSLDGESEAAYILNFSAHPGALRIFLP